MFDAFSYLIKASENSSSPFTYLPEIEIIVNDNVKESYSFFTEAVLVINLPASVKQDAFKTFIGDTITRKGSEYRIAIPSSVFLKINEISNDKVLIKFDQNEKTIERFLKDRVQYNDDFNLGYLFV